MLAFAAGVCVGVILTIGSLWLLGEALWRNYKW